MKHRLNGNIYYLSFGIKEQLLIMLQNVNEVNREPAHNERRLVHVNLTRQNCLVTTVCFLGSDNEVLRMSEWVVIRQILSKKRLLHKAIFIHSKVRLLLKGFYFDFNKLVWLSAVIPNRICINYYKPNFQC